MMSVMGDLYASALGTSVLQLQEVPPQPDDWPALEIYNARPYFERGWVRKMPPLGARYGSRPPPYVDDESPALSRFGCVHSASLRMRRRSSLRVGCI